MWLAELYKRYKHALLLIFWPLFGIAFLLYERVLPLEFHTVWCPLDDFIPFCEYFIIPYWIWYACMVSMMVLLFFKDPPEFKRYLWFIIFGYAITLIIYIIYPTKQELRPTSFADQNIFTDLVAQLYSTDTNTNVCPSIHVIGQMAAFFAAWRNPIGNKAVWRTVWVILTVLICLSTVCLKQHSIIDVFAGLAVSAVLYLAIYTDLLRGRMEKQTC